MDKNKLLEKINENKREQAKKYYRCMNNIICNNIGYYKEKEYAKYFFKINK